MIVNSIFISLATFLVANREKHHDVYIADLHTPQLACKLVVNEHLFEHPEST